MQFAITLFLFSALSVIFVAASPIAVSAPTVSTRSIGLPGKRGILYDYTSSDYCKYFVGSKVTFGSDYHATREETGATFDPRFGFISTLRTDNNLQNPTWINTMKPLIQSGAVKTVFANNEPDNAGQANLTPAQAGQVWKQYMMPLRGLGAALATPAITNGGGAAGLTYLANFLLNCVGCVFDVINIHHYVPRSDCTVDVAVAALKTYLDVTLPAFQLLYPQLRGLPLCIGEFWLWGASDTEGADYLRKLLPYLDNHPRVACYQAFGGAWKGRFINDAGTGLTLSGSVYRDY